MELFSCDASDWDAFLFVIFNLSVKREWREGSIIKKPYLFCGPQRPSYKVEFSSFLFSSPSTRDQCQDTGWGATCL